MLRKNKPRKWYKGYGKNILLLKKYIKKLKNGDTKINR